MGVFDFFKKPTGKLSVQQAAASSQASKTVRRILNDFASHPSRSLIDDLTAAVMDSKDPLVTDLLLDTLKHQNPGLRGLAIQCLGLVCDPRAMEAAFGAFQSTSGVRDHQQRAALSIVNLVNNGRDTSTNRMPYLMAIAQDPALLVSIKAFAVQALQRFRGDNAEVDQFLLRLRGDANEEIRLAAH